MWWDIALVLANVLIMAATIFTKDKDKSVADNILAYIAIIMAMSIVAFGGFLLGYKYGVQ